MMMTQQRIGILGTGAIGSLMAYHWQQEHLFALPRDQKSPTIISVQHTSLWQNELNAWHGEPLDWLVVCTKANNTLTALSPWLSFLPNVKRILLLQNGLGQHDECQTWLNDNNLSCELWAGSSTEGAYKTDEHVVYAGIGETVIGLWQQPTSQNTHTINEQNALPNTHIVNNIHNRLQMKLAVNAVINPLTALFKCHNGELLTNAQYYELLQQLTNEIAELYSLLNWPLPDSLINIVRSVAEKTAHNKSSTLQDILQQRPTELPYICGYLLKQAHSIQVELPITQQLMQQLIPTAS